MARLKVAICIESTIGGTRKHVRELALGLDPGRFDAHLVISLRRAPEMLNDIPRLARRGVRIHHVPMSRAISPVEMIRAFKPPVLVGATAQPGDVTITFADVDHARDLIGYQPSVDMEEGVRRFVDWFNEHGLSR